jgi:hypothetical protein
VDAIDANLLEQLPLSEVDKVTFYKRDEVTTDLVCCDVKVGERIWTFHEELEAGSYFLSIWSRCLALDRTGSLPFHSRRSQKASQSHSAAPTNVRFPPKGDILAS